MVKGRVSMASVLISVSFMHIIPKAFSMNGYAPCHLFGGYMGLHLFDLLPRTERLEKR